MKEKISLIFGIIASTFIFLNLQVLPVYADVCQDIFDTCLIDATDDAKAVLCDNELESCKSAGTVKPTGGGTSGDKYGLKQTASAATLPQNDDLTGQIGTIISKLLEYIAVIFFGLMLYGGFLWMTSAGANEKVTKAKGLIVNAILGLVIISAAYAITNFVIGAIG